MSASQGGRDPGGGDDVTGLALRAARAVGSVDCEEDDNAEKEARGGGGVSSPLAWLLRGPEGCSSPCWLREALTRSALRPAGPGGSVWRRAASCCHPNA